MKKDFLALFLLVVTMTMMAVPAKRGIWKTLTLTDGTLVRAQLMGDEHSHFWMTNDGMKYVSSDDSDDIFIPISQQEIASRAMKHRSRIMHTANSRQLAPNKVVIGERTHYLGNKKGLVMLVQFTDTKFKAGNTLERYKRILNEEGYSEGRFIGSVHDYFTAQSNSQFQLDFDVVGPYDMPKASSYYGSNDSQGNDLHPDEMVVEACLQADAEVNFADYDWDGDGAAEEVFVVYAGKGEAEGGGARTIWPHMYQLSATNMSLVLDDTTIDVYACSNELNSSNVLAGIGTFCHEFSHCMGFPDFYDTSYSGWFGMDSFDLMCSGNYNGNGYTPAGYTAHEKMMCGWQEPIVLANNDTLVQNLLPMSQHGETFIIYNEAHPDEYYMIENRQKDGWDVNYPSKGLMITHVDFDKEIWQNNVPNTKVTTTSDLYLQGAPLNDHQRMTIVHADNNEYYYQVSTDLYPYGTKDSLTAHSKPACTLYNKNSKDANVAEWGIFDISQQSDGTMSFRYSAPPKPKPKPLDGEVLFYESFNQCNGSGGNDDLWKGGIANALFLPDNEGWETLSDKAFGAHQCAKFGTSSVIGKTTTPSISINGDAILTFKAASWDTNADTPTLLLSVENATIQPSEFTMQRGAWTQFTATITGQGDIKVTFTPGKRFFLDEVKVLDAYITAIKDVESSGANSQWSKVNGHSDAIYTLDGRYVGTDISSLKRGIYVRNNKKIKK
jgi:M6 family metalloprotease-like protein